MRFAVINRKTSCTLMISILDGKGDTKGTRYNWIETRSARAFARGFTQTVAFRTCAQFGWKTRGISSAVAEYVGDSAFKIFRIGNDFL